MKALQVIHGRDGKTVIPGHYCQSKILVK